MKLQLYYDSLLVGDIAAPLLHQGTWFGDFHQVIAAGDGLLARRVCDFISFCQQCHLKPNAKPSEFEQFSDLLRSGLWCTKGAAGPVGKIEEAPYFMNGEISWRLQRRENPE